MSRRAPAQPPPLAPPLKWHEQPWKTCWVASFGEEGQGVATVWHSPQPGEPERYLWCVDVLPADREPQIKGVRIGIDAATSAAERQVAAWPTLIDGARRYD